MRIDILVNLTKAVPLPTWYLADKLFSSGVPPFTGTYVLDPLNESFEIPEHGGGHIWSISDSDRNVIAAINKNNPSVI
jgi:hypothetical protein